MIYEKIIKPLMGEKRFKHCLNVSKSAQYLAKKYGADIESARIAGILHDITKEFGKEEQMELVEKFNIEISEFELTSKKLLHANTGAAYIENVLGIEKRDIINAVKYHTTARAGMSLLEKVLFIADFISEDRDYEGVDEIRRLAERSLDDAMIVGLKDIINNLLQTNKPIHKNTIESYNEIAFKKGRSDKSMTAIDISNKICEILKDKKAIDVNLTCIKDVSVLADYFVFATGTSNTHVKSLADEVELKLKDKGILINSKEKDGIGSWILLDYGDVIVHIFTGETRKIYNVEQLWNKAKEKFN